MTVAELLSRMSSAELTEWMAFEKVEGPIGPARGDVQAAVVAMTVANVNRGKRRPFKLSDFVPTWDRDSRAQSTDQMIAAVKQMNRAMGGTVTRRGDGDGDAG